MIGFVATVSTSIRITGKIAGFVTKGKIQAICCMSFEI